MIYLHRFKMIFFLNELVFIIQKIIYTVRILDPNMHVAIKISQKLFLILTLYLPKY